MDCYHKHLPRKEEMLIFFGNYLHDNLAISYTNFKKKYILLFMSEKKEVE